MNNLKKRREFAFLRKLSLKKKQHPPKIDARSKPSWLAVYGSVVSTLAFLGSSVSLYMSTFREANIHISTGEFASLSIHRFGNLMLSSSFSIANTGSRPGIVRRISVEFYKKWDDRKKIPMPPSSYLSHTSTRLEVSGEPIAEVIQGGGAITRTIQFWSYTNWMNIMGKIEKGVYVIDYFAWIDDDEKPRKFSSETITVGDWEIDRLSTPSTGTIIQVDRWRNGQPWKL